MTYKNHNTITLCTHSNALHYVWLKSNSWIAPSIYKDVTNKNDVSIPNADAVHTTLYTVVSILKSFKYNYKLDAY